jgi:hypothetical protein
LSFYLKIEVPPKLFLRYKTGSEIPLGGACSVWLSISIRQIESGSRESVDSPRPVASENGPESFSRDLWDPVGDVW